MSVLSGRDNADYPAPGDSAKLKQNISDSFKQQSAFSGGGKSNVLSGAEGISDSGARNDDNALGANNWIKPDKGNDFSGPSDAGRKSTSYGS